VKASEGAYHMLEWSVWILEDSLSCFHLEIIDELRLVLLYVNQNTTGGLMDGYSPASNPVSVGPIRDSLCPAVCTSYMSL
jgi:hypothetical protein